MPSSATSTIRCAAALSTHQNTQAALREACQQALEQLGGRPDLAMLFFSPTHARHAERLAAEACDLLGSDNLMGCTGESIVGTGREVEEEPALSLWLARWPGVQSSLFS